MKTAIELLQEIDDHIKSIQPDIAKAMKGNKAAARRVRKFTSTMGNGVGKEYRKVSVSEGKE